MIATGALVIGGNLARHPEHGKNNGTGKVDVL